MIVAQRPSVADANQLERRAERERVKVFAKHDEFIEFACGVAARHRLVNANTWPSGATREFARRAAGAPRELSLILRCDVTADVLDEMLSWTSLPFDIRVSVRKYEDLGYVLDDATPDAPLNATVAMLRAMDPALRRLPRVAVRIVIAAIVLGERRITESRFCAETAMPGRNVRVALTQAALPTLPRILGSVLCVHIAYKLHALELDPKAVAERSAFGSVSAMDMFVSRRMKIRRSQLRFDMAADAMRDKLGLV